MLAKRRPVQRNAWNASTDTNITQELHLAAIDMPLANVFESTAQSPGVCLFTVAYCAAQSMRSRQRRACNSDCFFANIMGPLRLKAVSA